MRGKSPYFGGMISPEQARQKLVEVGRRLYDRGMLAGTDGNLSTRLSDSNILVTPSGAAKGNLSPDDLVVVDLQGNHVSGHRRASSESAMHLSMYRLRPDIGACVHSHAPHATAFAAAGRPLPYDILPEVVLFVGPIPLTEYAPPGTLAVPESLAPFAADHDAFLLRNHGLLTVGVDLDEALHRHETVEHYAHILWLALALGHVSTIPADDCRRLDTMRNEMRRRPRKP